MTSEDLDYPVNTIVPGKLVYFPDTTTVKSCHRGWVAGPYVKGLEGIPFEVKQELQRKGETRTEWAKPAPGTTLVLILSGSVTISYEIDGRVEDVTLTANQSILQDNSIPHKWIVTEDDTMVISVRYYGGS